MNSKWFYMIIVAYRIYNPVFWFPLRGKQLNHDPTEFVTRKEGALSLISELHKIKNSFSLFRHQAANFQISTIWANALHWHIQNKYCVSKMELQANIAHLWKKEIILILEHLEIFVRKTTTESRRCCNVNARSEDKTF